MAQNPNYQRSYYAKNRSRRLAESIEYQRQHREERAEYLRAYYRANKHRWKPRTRALQDKINATKRAKYWSDDAFREECKRLSRSRDPVSKRDGRLRSDHGITTAEFDDLFTPLPTGVNPDGSEVRDPSGGEK